MIVVYGCFAGLIIILIVMAKNKTIPKEWNIKKDLIPFSKASILLYELLENLSGKELFKPNKKTGDYLEALHSVGNRVTLGKIYQIQKAGIVMLLIFLGTCIGILAECVSYGGGSLSKEGELSRNAYGGGKKVVQLEAKAEQGEKEYLEVELWEKQFTDKELDSMWQPFIEILKQTVKGENLDLTHIDKKLNLCSSVEGFPFQIEWDTRSTDLLHMDGTLNLDQIVNEQTEGDKKEIDLHKNDQIGNNLVESGSSGIKPMKMEPIESSVYKCTITATVTYMDWTKRCDISLGILSNFEEEKQLSQKLAEEIKREEEKSRKQEKIVLPEIIEGKPIQWKEIKNGNGLGILILVAAAAVAVYKGKDIDLQKKAEERKKQMLSDYPEIISKLSLLVSTGMTIPMAWRQIAMDYGLKKDKMKKVHNYAYEEMLLTCYEIESGIPLIKALENFGRRCKVQKYKRLSSLLIQNMKKGSAGLIAVLKEEVKVSFEERKNIARRLGEEASTKLLLPMTLMLLVVMMIIMIPAFLSFAAF